MNIPPLSGIEAYVTSDGKLTWEGQRMFQAIIDLVEASEGKLDAVAGVTAPAGGGTVDAEARTAIAAIITAAT